MVSQVYIHTLPVMSYSNIVWVKNDPGNGILSAGARPSPEALLTYRQWRLVTNFKPPGDDEQMLLTLPT